MVMPLFDDAPAERSRRPFATYGLIAINVAVYLYELTLSTRATDALVASLGMTPALVSDQPDAFATFPPLLTLVTYQFLHGDIFHLFSNMLFLWVFGDNIEDSMGPLRFLAFYLLCGIAGALWQVAIDARSAVPLIGASGAVSGVIVAYLMVRPCAKVAVLVMYLVVKISAFWVVGAFIVLQFVNLTLNVQDEVAYWAHVGGLLAGAVLFPLFRYRHVKLFQCIGRPDRPAISQS